jgi:DnaD/phage-associated family protein
MPLFTSAETMEYTLVPNSFILGYMKNAPGAHVKVYLYGLYFLNCGSHADISEFCCQLDMSYNEVVEAFEYWQQRGLVKIINGKECRFEYQKPMPSDSSILYTEQEYNITLQKLFGMRVLGATDYQRVYDYTDQFGLSKDVVLMLLEYCIKIKGPSISFSYIDKVAKTWADSGVSSVAAASAVIAKYEAGISDAAKALGYLGIHRSPTPDEMQLMHKWTKEWGFTLDAIKTACVKTTGSRSPSMKYLDTILKSLHEKGLTTSRTIHTEGRENQQLSDKVKEVLRTIGFSDLTVSPEHIAYYNKWANVFPHDTLLLAAKQMVKYSTKSMEYFDKILENWQSSNLLSMEDIASSMENNAALQAKIQALFKLAGIKKRATEADRKKYLQWTKEWGFTEDVLRLACETSSVSENPYRYLDKLLSIWHEKNIKTAAQASRAVMSKASAAPAKKNNAESLKYIQRDIKDEDMTFLYANLKRDTEEK